MEEPTEIQQDVERLLVSPKSVETPSNKMEEEGFDLSGLFVESQQPEKRKKVYAKKNIPLTVISAKKGKIAKNGFCRASKSANVKKNCVSVSAKSKTRVTYKFGVKSLPKKLMKKGAAIKVRLSDCKTMATQSKCKSATLLKAPKPRKNK